MTARGPQGPPDGHGPSVPPAPPGNPRHGGHRSEHGPNTGGPDPLPGITGPGDRGSQPLPDDPEAAEERRLAALYGIGDPPPPDGGRNPFWWVWVFVVPFMLAAMGLMIWRISTAPDRMLPGL